MTQASPDAGPTDIGILAVQGGYHAHARTLRSLGHSVCLVRYASQLDTIAGLILPGGESTTQLKLIEREALGPALDQFMEGGKPVLATCAGLILAARRVTNPKQASFGWLDLTVARNAWGRQVHSFEATADDSDMPLLFIRAPRIETVGPDVEVMARYDGEPVLVRQKAFVGATFHPELSGDNRVHAAVFGRP